MREEKLLGDIENALKSELTQSNILGIADKEVVNDFIKAKTEKANLAIKKEKRKDGLHPLKEFLTPLGLGFLLSLFVIIFFLSIFLENKPLQFFFGFFLGILLPPAWKKFVKLF